MLLTEDTKPPKSGIWVESKSIEKVSTEGHVDTHEEIDHEHWQVRRVMALHVRGVARELGDDEWHD